MVEDVKMQDELVQGLLNDAVHHEKHPRESPGKEEGRQAGTPGSGEEVPRPKNRRAWKALFCGTRRRGLGMHQVRPVHHNPHGMEET
eukprot:3622285-Heterocapsa_arctica.AAC.1